MKRLLLAAALTMAPLPAEALVTFDWAHLPAKMDQSQIERLVREAAKEFTAPPYADAGPMDFFKDPSFTLRIRFGTLEEKSHSYVLYDPLENTLTFNMRHVALWGANEPLFRSAILHEFSHVYDKEKGRLPQSLMFYRLRKENAQRTQAGLPPVPIPLSLEKAFQAERVRGECRAYTVTLKYLDRFPETHRSEMHMWVRENRFWYCLGPIIPS